jgi:hypothetical protein
MLSVDAACAFAFSLGREGLNIRPPQIAFSSVALTRLLVRAFWNDATSSYVCCKASSEPSPCGLMIVWALGRRASKLCICPCMNRSWRHLYRLWNSPNALTSCCVPRPSGNRYNRRRESRRQDMSGFTRSPSRSPDLGEPQAAQDVSTTQTATCRMSQRVWTNANLAKEFVKVKTYSDLLVLRQDANDNGLSCT